jgi:TolA-binding protein
LLRQAQTYRVSDKARVVTLAAVGLAGTAALGTSQVAAAGSLGSKVWAWIAVAAVVSGGALGVQKYVSSGENQSAASAPKVAPAVAPKVAAAVADEPAVVASPVADRPQEAAPTPARPATVKRVAPAVDDLGSELAALAMARKAASQGDHAAALRHLRTYRSEFPRGRLSLEAEVLTIEALAESGEKAQAGRRAQSFLSQNPKSLFVERVRRYAE